MAPSPDLALIELRALVQRAETIREKELRRLYARCTGLTERERTLIAEMSNRLIAGLLSGAISKICEKALVDRVQAANDARMLSDLFDVPAVEYTQTAMRSAG
jgi:glutamyl-tRNA reductase